MKSAIRVAASVVLMSVAIAILAALLVESRIGAAMSELHAHMLDAVAQSMAQSLEAGMGGWLRELEALSRIPALRDATSPTEAKRAELDDFRYRHPELAWVGYIDARSGVVVAASNGIHEGRSAAGRSVFEEGRHANYVGPAQEKANLEQALLARPDGRPRLFAAIGVPVPGPAGDITGVIGGYLDLSWVERVRAGTPTSRGVETFMVDANGAVILDGSGAMKAETLAPVLRAFNAAQPAQRVRWPDSREFLTAVAPAYAYGAYAPGWSVITRESVRGIGAPARQARDRVALSCLGVGVLAATIAGIGLARRRKGQREVAAVDALTARERSGRWDPDRFVRREVDELRSYR